MITSALSRSSTSGRTDLSLLVLAALLALQTPRALAQVNSAADPELATLPQARTLIDAKDFSHAEALLRQLPRSADAAFLLAYTLMRQNKPADSLAEYTRAATLRTPSAEDLKNVAQDYALLNDYPDALRWSGRAVALDPANAEAWYGLGRIQYTQQLFAQAARSFERVLALVAQSVKAENNLGLAYEGLNQQENAIAAYRQAIAWQSGAPPAQRSEQPLLNLAILLLHRQQLTEAEPLLREAVARTPHDPRIHEQLGHLYLQQGAYSSAQAELETATRLDPANSSLHFLLGQAYRRLGLQDQARREFAASARLANPSTTPH